MHCGPRSLASGRTGGKEAAAAGDPRRQEALGPVRQTMAEMFEGEPKFTDMDVVVERSY